VAEAACAARVPDAVAVEGGTLMMTRTRIVELLDLMVLEFANAVPPPRAVTVSSLEQAVHGGPAVSEYEWAFVKGLVASHVVQMRDRIRQASG
jgi:hypothetical protein